MNSILESISNLLTTSPYIAPLLAFIAGVLTSFTPCSLSSVPLIIGYVNSGEHKAKKAFKLSLVFAIGTAFTFTILGTIATTLGSMLGTFSSWYFITLGILMLLMALQTWELYQIIPSTYLVSKSKKKGYLGSLIAGILAGIFASPCSTPVLITLLALVSTSENIVWGILLLLCYSIGHGVLAVICGTSVGFSKKLMHSEKYGKISNIIKIIMGLFMSLLGFYMFYIAF